MIVEKGIGLLLSRLTIGSAIHCGPRTESTCRETSIAKLKMVDDTMEIPLDTLG